MGELMSNGVTPPGPGVDARGNPVIDPTANVIAMLDAAVQRQDDLRAAESRHVREINDLRASFQTALQKAETDRINAIRAVDVGQVQRAAEVQADAASALASTVVNSAEAMRTQVAAAATAAATSLAAALVPIQEAIADLRRAQYEQQGQKQQVVETRETSTGTRQWTGIIIAAGIGFSGLILSLSGIVIALLLRKP
jgi:ElaB/YqjD/DUF883 family membrane-anchored ribosome-binding protein